SPTPLTFTCASVQCRFRPCCPDLTTRTMIAQPGRARYRAIMLRYDPRLRRLAIGLSMLAGYIDALGFLRMRGLFVSFMSGNSTRLAVGLALESRVALRASGL